MQQSVPRLRRVTSRLLSPVIMGSNVRSVLRTLPMLLLLPSTYTVITVTSGQMLHVRMRLPGISKQGWYPSSPGLTATTRHSNHKIPNKQSFLHHITNAIEVGVSGVRRMLTMRQAQLVYPHLTALSVCENLCRGSFPITTTFLNGSSPNIRAGQ